MNWGGNNGQLDPGRLALQRHDMVEKQIRRRHITDGRVLECLERVPRHEFVPAEFRDRAYEDSPLPIGDGQTISQPYIVAAMTAALHLTGSERVLEIGTGFGYQAAVLACMAREVFTVEFRAELAAEAAERLGRLGYRNVRVYPGDGTLGLAEFAPFDAILVAAAAPALPVPLVEQLADGGRLVVPVGGAENQDLQLVERDHDTFRSTVLEPCRFVPLLGAHGWKDAPRQ
jgi:protein-L-isoaspartate(D-aspartate) O-methyltransferase